MASRWDIRCGAPRCPFARKRIDSKSDAKRHAAAHERTCGALHKVALEEVKPLSNTVRVGDRIRLKESATGEYRAACLKAGWEGVDLGAIRTVERIDQFGTGGRPRLFFEGPPFAFYPSDVQLAWNSDDERRQGLGL